MKRIQSTREPLTGCVMVQKTRKQVSLREQRLEGVETVEEDPVSSAGESAETEAPVHDDGHDDGSQPFAEKKQYVRVVKSQPNSRYRVINEFTEKSSVYQADQKLRLTSRQHKRRQQAARRPMVEEQWPEVADCQLIDDDELPNTIMTINGTEVPMKIDSCANSVLLVVSKRLWANDWLKGLE